jgi:hypothetical protein
MPLAIAFTRYWGVAEVLAEFWRIYP